MTILVFWKPHNTQKKHYLSWWARIRLSISSTKSILSGVVGIINTNPQPCSTCERIFLRVNDSKISLIKRDQKTKNDNYNIIFSEFGKAIGFNPSLLTLLIFDEEIKSIGKNDNFFTKLQKAAELENVKTSEKLKMLNCIEKKHIDLITPLCPDYEHVKIASGLYKYTFNIIIGFF